MAIRSHRAAAATVVLLLLPAVAFACLWDYDTLKMERSRFPTALELITGKFLRHSPEFYQWRIDNRLKRLEADPANAALLDDLAVAYDKIGQHDKAIETAIKTESLHPGRYETAANLATFYFHAGRLEEGLPHIERALQINPDAHFGREKYQKLLVEYVIQRRAGGPLVLPLAKTKSVAASDPAFNTTFSWFITPREQEGRLTPEQTSAAVSGVLGMMKFGQHDSPVLLESLGSLLTNDFTGQTEDAKLLATRAYLKASYDSPEESPARRDYRKMASDALEMQTPGNSSSQISLAQVELSFQKEIAEARAWYAQLRDRELDWIRTGKNPEAEFDKLYDADPQVSGMNVRDPASPQELNSIMAWGAVLLIASILLAAWIRRRRGVAGRS